MSIIIVAACAFYLVSRLFGRGKEHVPARHHARKARRTGRRVHRDIDEQIGAWRDAA